MEVIALPGQFEEEPEFEGTPRDSGPLVLAGLGGSGLAGELAGLLIGPRMVRVVREERLPDALPAGASVICVSFSGDTGETLAVWDEARARGIPVAAVASGGALRDRARAAGCPHATVSGGLSPRSSLGYLVRGVLAAAGERRDRSFWADVRRHLETVHRDWMLPRGGSADSPVDALSKALADSLPAVLFTGALGAAAARRWVADFAENAQVPALAWPFPEAAHNAIQTVARDAPRRVPMALVALDTARGKDEGRRWTVSLDLLAETGVPVHRVRALHPEPWIEAVGLCYLGDWVSVGVAERLGVRAADLTIMNELKSRLGHRP